MTVEEINASASQDDPKTEELATLAAASRGLVHRSRVVTKRLNSLCALHPRLMWEVEEGKRLLLPGCADAKPPAFPDPYELGTLEVTHESPGMQACPSQSCAVVLICSRQFLWKSHKRLEGTRNNRLRES